MKTPRNYKQSSESEKVNVIRDLFQLRNRLSMVPLELESYPKEVKGIVQSIDVLLERILKE